MQYKLFLASFLFPLFAISQNIIKGKIVNQDNKPLESIEVLLLSNDIIPLKNDITDSKGNFLINSLDGSYFFQVKQLGTVLKQQNITLIKFLDLGTIMVTENQQKLSEVVVYSKKKLIERKVDRLVFNVENSISASGGDAIDALKVTPGLRVQNDQITMIGKSGLGVMVDDRLIQLSGDDLVNYLKSISSNNIKSIEVITTPPAKYDAEGNSGIINIKLKKPKNDSWSAALRNTTKQATYLSDNIGANFSFQKAKISLLSDLGVNTSKTIYENDITYNYPSSFWNKYIHNVNLSTFFTPTLTLNYKISEKSTVGVQYIGAYGKPTISDYSVTNITDKTNNNALINQYFSDGNTRNNFSRNSFNINETTKFDDKGKTMSFDLDYFTYKNVRNNPFNSFIKDNNNSTILDNSIKNYGSLDIRNYSFKTDFSIPTTFANYEFGGKLSFINTDSEVNINFFDNLSNTNYLNNNNKFNYKENTQALYFSANKKLKKWEFKTGLRFENTQTKGFLISEYQINNKDYFKFFPTIYATYTPNDNHSLSLTFNRRITRPTYNYVNPARIYSTINNYVYGNPFLQPYFSYNLELQHNYKDIFTTTMSYSIVSNVVSQINIPNLDNTQVATWENYADYNSLNLDESINYKLKEWWTTVSSVYFNYRTFKSHIVFIKQSGSGISSGLETRHTFTVNKAKTFFIEGSYWYDLPSVSMERTYSSNSSLDLSVKHFFIDKNLQFTLIFNNILKSDRLKSNYTFNGIEQSFRQYYDTKYIRLSILYKFGNSKISSKQRKIGNQEEIQRSNQ